MIREQGGTMRSVTKRASHATGSQAALNVKACADKVIWIKFDFHKVCLIIKGSWNYNARKVQLYGMYDKEIVHVFLNPVNK